MYDHDSVVSLVQVYYIVTVSFDVLGYVYILVYYSLVHVSDAILMHKCIIEEKSTFVR